MHLRPRVPSLHFLLYSWLPSGVKAWAYRAFRGYRIADGVRLGMGSVILGTDVEIAEGVEIGPTAVISARTVRIGARARIGATSVLRCDALVLGDDTTVQERVVVDGDLLPASRFTLGQGSVVVSGAAIYPSRSVEIGDDTSIGGHAVIVTSDHPGSALDGYPSESGPVRVGDRVTISWRAYVGPGVTIGDGAMVRAGASVVEDVPASSLVEGIPARVVAGPPDFPREPTVEDRLRIVDDFMTDFDRYAAHVGVKVGRQGLHRVYEREGRVWRLTWERTAVPNTAVVGRDDTVLSETALPAKERDAYRERGVFWIDLERRMRSERGSPLTDDLTTFLTRYGVRLRRE